jgi:hypothetical protein
MTFFMRLAIMAVAASAIALAVVSRRSAAGARDGRSARAARPLAMSLAVVLASLAVVGVVSHTVMRHAIQVLPLVVALALMMRPALGVAAAAPLFAFWLLLMIAVWLLLLGIAHIVNGTFTTMEIVLTMVIGAGSLAGLTSAWRCGSRAPFAVQAALVVAFAAFQYAAMIVSTFPFARA